MAIFVGNYCRNNRLATEISIQQKITGFRSRNNKNPIIIVDLMYYDQLSGYLHLSGTNVKMADLCGLSRKRVSQLESFIANMKSWGAELIFITNGPYLDISGQIIPDADDSKGSSKDWRYDLQCGIIDYLSQVHYSEVAADAKFIPIERIWTESVNKIARKYGKILWAWDNTRHQEIAKYASAHDVLAILSKNYALLLYSGTAFPKYKLWSLVDCNVTKMSTMEFDPLTLRRTLKLSTQQIRLLAALCDQYKDTPTFYSFVERNRINQRFLFPSLADYVKKTAGNLLELDYLKVARDLFGELKYIEKFDEFKTVCESYDINKITLSSEQNNDSISMQLKKQDSFNYDIYHGVTFLCSITFVDYRYWQMHGIDFYEIVMSLYRRISGVILQHKKDTSLVRYIRIKRSHAEPYGVAEFEPEYPRDLCVPSLDYIFSISGQTLTTVPEFNMSLLQFITGMPCHSLEFFCQTDQRPKLQDSYTLRYMVTLNMMSRFEADIFLLAIQKCRGTLDTPCLPKTLDTRAFHLYFTYIKMRTLIKHAFYSSGLDESFMDECYLDGVIFQNLFQKWINSGETEEFREEVSRFERYRLH